MDGQKTVNMAPFRIRKFRSSRSDRKAWVVVMIDLEGSPDPHYFPNLYITENYEVVGRSPNTIDKVLRALGMA